MIVSGRSVRGLREHNQDRIYSEIRNGSYIFAVADGMGGTEGGAEASQMVIDTCKASFKNFSSNPTNVNITSTIEEIVVQTNIKIQEYIKNEPEFEGMGSTLTILLGFKNHCKIGNIGDSRTYVYNNGIVYQITKDHTHVQDLKDTYFDKTIDEKTEKSYGHIITKSIGGSDDQIDIYPRVNDSYNLTGKEKFILCSDGYITYNEKEQKNKLKEILESESDVEKCVNALIKQALDNNSKDNISVLIGDFRRGQVKQKKPEIHDDNYKTIKIVSHKKPRLRKYLYLLATIILLVLCWFFIRYWQQSKNQIKLIEKNDKSGVTLVDTSLNIDSNIKKDTLFHNETVLPDTAGDTFKNNDSLNKNISAITEGDIYINE